MMERTRMLSVAPGTCGGSMQAPRTIRSICTPACPASTSAWIRTSSVMALLLITTRAYSPLRAAFLHESRCASMVCCSMKGAITSLFSCGRVLGLARWRKTASMSAVSTGSQVR